MDPNANIIFGALVDDSMEGEIAITVIATGFPLAGPTQVSLDLHNYSVYTLVGLKGFGYNRIMSSIQKGGDTTEIPASPKIAYTAALRDSEPQIRQPSTPSPPPSPPPKRNSVTKTVSWKELLEHMNSFYTDSLSQ